MMYFAQPADLHIAVNDARPMWVALRMLEQKFGWRLHYEDPSAAGKIDILVKVTAKPAELLQALIQQTHGGFKFKAVGDAFVIMPENGSILDTRISLPEGSHTVGDVARAVSEATGIPFHSGVAGSLTFSASDEPARDSVLRLIPPGFAYDLLYTPGSGYVLTAHEAKITVTLPDARKQYRQSRP